MTYGTNDEDRLLTYAASTDHQSSPSPSPPPPSSSSSSHHATGSTTIAINIRSKVMPSSSHPHPSSQPPPAAPEGSGLQASAGPLAGAAAEHMTSYVRQTWTDCRPWTEFYSTAAINLPPFDSLSERMSTNLHLYRNNYQVVAAVWLGLFVVSAIPSFLLAVAAFFLLDKWAARLAGRNNGKLPHRDMVVLGLVALAIVWLTGIAQHVLSSLALSSVSVLAHAALHEPVTIETEIPNV